MTKDMNERFINIEMSLDNLAKEIDDLNEMVIKQGKIIDTLIEQNKALRQLLEPETVRPLSQETPPPHY